MAEDSDEPKAFYIVYVSNGREFRDECTKEVFQKILGPAPQEGAPPPGLNTRTRVGFVVHKDKKGIVTSLDVLVNNDYVRGMVPDDLLGKKYLEIEVDPVDGSVEVLLIPAKVKDAVVNDILAGLDKEAVVRPGLKLGGKYLVREVAGNRIAVQPFIEKTR